MGVWAQEVRGVRPISVSTNNALVPVRQALSPATEVDGSEPEPNPQLALQLLDRINIDPLPGHEKAEVYFLFAYTNYLLENTDQAKRYFQMIVDEPEANAPLAVRTIKQLAQLHASEQEWDRALELYLEWMTHQDVIDARDYAFVGIVYFNMGDENNALEYLERAIDMREANGERGEESWYNIQRTINSGGSATTVFERQQGELAAPLADQDIVPLRAIQPNYPSVAVERGLEGYCVVSFTITTAGTTRNVQEEECTNSVFMRESIRAAERLEYDPVVVDGRAVEVNHYYKFTYEMADEDERSMPGTDVPEVSTPPVAALQSSSAGAAEPMIEANEAAQPAPNTYEPESPQLRVAVHPAYPGRASELNLSGFCEVRFTITAAGTTKDIEQVECSNSIFLPTSIRAARALEYHPTIVDGRPIAVPKQTYKFTFCNTDSRAQLAACQI